MKDIHNKAIMKGRPYGGTGFIFSKRFTTFLQPVLKYECERLSVMKLSDKDYTILIINAYFPFKQTGDDYRIQYLEVLGSIEDIILSNPSAKFIITGDFNCNIFDVIQPMSSTICRFLDNYNLVSSHSIDPSFNEATSYTRCCLKSGNYSILDYVFVSRTLLDRVKECGIDYDGRNPSDHFPVTLKLDVVPDTSGDAICTDMYVNNKVRWSSLSDGTLENYR